MGPICCAHHTVRLPCRVALIHTCRVLRESPRVAAKIVTANPETPHGSRKKPNMGRSPTGRDRSRHGYGVLCVSQTRSHCVIQMENTQSISLATRYGMICVNNP
jgi:hypothetical protein